MAQDRRKRPWIKQRLADSADSIYAYKIWERWKAVREASKNVARAIRLYDALLKGDMKAFHKMMTEFFPGYGMSLEMPRQSVQQYMPAASMVLSNGNGHHPKPAPAEIIISSEAHDEIDDDDDDLGFASLDIG